jgi:NADH-quinone oxidoreductase subunit L
MSLMLLSGKKLPRQGDWVSIIGIFLSFLFSLNIFLDFQSQYSANYYVHKVFSWMDLSYLDLVFKVDLGIYIDNLSSIMLLMVTGVATLIHIFSTFYMHGEERYGRFFTYLSLFTASMIGLVLSDNLLTVFVFWELMGFCSYALIGFYTEKDKAGFASMKAFLTTRVGDVIFLLGIMALWVAIGSINYVDIYAAIAAGSFEGQKVLGIAVASFAAFCLFCGTIGKSAQFPLQIWLPDAMMGPTPCSALIHAATMVAAGVYLSLRMYPLMVLGEITTFIAFIGAMTAFIAASIALVQNDIKAVLAYSTISQLGYMVLGIGVGSYSAAFMHLITHAVFKACLFLSAGSVIHSLHDPDSHGHVQDMRQMGGLKNKLPFTHIAMLISTLAIAGVPFFSGFVSKDRILGDALYWSVHGMSGWTYFIPTLLGFITALLTPFYMFRMMLMTFYVKPKNEKVYHHCHKEHFSLNGNLPLLILSVFAFGFIYCGSLTGQGIGKVFSEKYEWFKVLVQAPDVNKFSSYKSEKLASTDLRESVAFEKSTYAGQTGYFGPNPNVEEIHHAHTQSAIVSVILALLGIGFAFFWFLGKDKKFPEILKPVYEFLDNKWHLDTLLTNGSSKLTAVVFRASKWFDQVIIDGIMVDGAGVMTSFFGVLLNYWQSGRIQHYFTMLILAFVAYIVIF